MFNAFCYFKTAFGAHAVKAGVHLVVARHPIPGAGDLETARDRQPMVLKSYEPIWVALEGPDGGDDGC